MEERVILVDEFDNPIGTEEKLKAHEDGVLHRAFSVFIFDTSGKMLLQKRASEKYHSGGLWTNTCCSHPKPNELTLDAANRRLMEEMGMKSELHYCFSFQYKAELDSDLIENEFDHVFIGVTDDLPILNTNEAEGFKYMETEQVIDAMEENPKDYTEWFKICINELNHYIVNKKIA